MTCNYTIKHVLTFMPGTQITSQIGKPAESSVPHISTSKDAVTSYFSDVGCAAVSTWACAVDRNNSCASFISLLLLDAYRIF